MHRCWMGLVIKVGHVSPTCCEKQFRLDNASCKKNIEDGNLAEFILTYLYLECTNGLISKSKHQGLKRCMKVYC